MLAILQYPHPALNKKAKTVTADDLARLQPVIDDMIETLYHTDNCAGLAATQLAITDPYRITVIDVSAEKNQLLVLLNPEVLALEEMESQWEACMSVLPGAIHGQVMRAKKITYRAQDRHGKIIEAEAEGLLAKCIQHETDHLNGKLYIDHLSPLKRAMIDKKIAKLQRGEEA
jgi:peptide deformylase